MRVDPDFLVILLTYRCSSCFDDVLYCMPTTNTINSRQNPSIADLRRQHLHKYEKHTLITPILAGWLWAILFWKKLGELNITRTCHWLNPRFLPSQNSMEGRNPVFVRLRDRAVCWDSCCSHKDNNCVGIPFYSSQTSVDIVSNPCFLVIALNVASRWLNLFPDFG